MIKNTQAYLQDALQELPASLQSQVADIVNNKNFDATISKQQLQVLMSISGLSEKQLKLTLLPLAAAFSISPISQFRVGAITQGNSGTLYFGANLEIQGVQLGQAIHAEQSAISHAWMKGETGLSDITINYSPCGHCRQFMNEISTAQSLSIQLPGRQAKSLQEYLPESFGPKDLGVDSGLMTPVDHQLTTTEDDPLINLALQSLNRSHAPYTKNFSGVAIELRSGLRFHGAYAENAAFNPSLPPLQVALVQLVMAQADFKEIKKVALIESASMATHLANTQANLDAINKDITLLYRLI